MQNAIIAIVPEVGAVALFTSKTAAVAHMQEKGLTRAKARELANAVADGSTLEFTGDDGRSYMVTPAAERAEYEAAQNAPKAAETSPVKSEQAPAPAKASKPRHNPPRLVAALFARAGFGFAIPA